MLPLAHYRFKQTSIIKACCVVIDVNEAHTSKTCDVCGHRHAKLGARNIMLRALRDTSLTVNQDGTAIVSF